MTLHARMETKIEPGPLLRALDRAREIGCTKQAANVAERARSLIVRRARTSRPGETPTDRTGRLRRLIQSAWDASRKAALAGPALVMSARPGGDGQPVGSTIPAVLEHGGQIRNAEVFVRGQWRNDTQRLRRVAPNATRRTRTVQIDARPYMAPAMRIELPKFAEQFRDTIRGD